MTPLYKKLATEAAGTFLLVFTVPGTAVFGIAAHVGIEGAGPGAGIVGVGLAAALFIVATAYAFGPISGAHVNPAVTLAFMLGRRMPTKDGLAYMAAQVVGGIAAGFAFWAFVNWFEVTDYTGGLGSNGYGGSINMAGAFVLETMLTAAFVGIILLATERVAAPGFAGMVIGFSLGLMHLVAVPLTGAGFNPARSIGPALFAGGEAVSQLWLFIAAPLVGSLIAVAIWRFLRTTTEADEAIVAGAVREG